MRYAAKSVTSLEAAIDNLPRAGTQRRAIFDALHASHSGLTRDELEVQLGLSGNAVRPRIRELEDEGLVRETKHTRRTRSGSQAAVLVATNVGSSTEDGIELRGGAVDDALGVASGVERPGISSPSGGAPPTNPYEAEVWVE